MAKVKKSPAKEFAARLARVLAEDAAGFSRPLIRRHSRTLADAIQVLATTHGARVYLPHYWALYVHDGRGAPVFPRKATVLIWFRETADDPRLAGGFPVRAKDLRRLTGPEFRSWKGENAKADAAGLPRPMIIVPFIKNPTKATRFWDNDGGMRPWLPLAQRKGTGLTRAFVLDLIGKDLFINETLSVRL